MKNLSCLFLLLLITSAATQALAAKATATVPASHPAADAPDPLARLLSLDEEDEDGYRTANRNRPIIGDRRPPSPLCNIHPDHWLADYTTELLNVLNVLGLLVQLEPSQAAPLDKICSGPTLFAATRRSTGAFELPKDPKRKKRTPAEPSLFTR